MPWADPEAMFEGLFGKGGAVDEKALAAIEVTPKEEQQIGKRAVDAYLAQLRQQRLRLSVGGRQVEYLRGLVDKLRPMMTNQKRYPTIRIYLVLSSRCDARSFPGGHLVFFRGLLETAENEAALLGIVGHELSHVDRGHHTRRIREMKLAEQTFSGGGKATSFEQFFATGGTLMRTWMRPFRPELEREADEDGARWSYLAGYDCREMAKLILGLRRHPLGDLPIPEFFRSHPPAAERHRAIIEQYEELQAERPNAGLRLGEESLRRHARRR